MLHKTHLQNTVTGWYFTRLHEICWLTCINYCYSAIIMKLCKPLTNLSIANYCSECLCRSQYPLEMMPLLLDHTLSFPYPPALPLSQPAPHSFTSLTQALTFLSRTYRDQLKHATVDAFSRILDGGCGSVRMMLIVATHCPPLTKFLADDCLQFSESYEYP